MSNGYKAPSVAELAFTCPHCGVYARHRWFLLGLSPMTSEATPAAMIGTNLPKDRIAINFGRGIGCSSYFDNVFSSSCAHCGQVLLWLYDKVLWPTHGSAPPPTQDLPDDIKRDYEEAASIATLSPRGAAAILRLCVQKLCAHLGEKGHNIDADIAALVRKGLDPRVQQMLDVVRVIGNNAVHPGKMDITDDQETVGKLFGLINMITFAMITHPKEVDAMYNTLPATNLAAIQQRDNKP